MWIFLILIILPGEGQEAAAELGKGKVEDAAPGEAAGQRMGTMTCEWLIPWDAQSGVTVLWGEKTQIRH